MFRKKPTLEVLLAHPGGPFWARKDEGAWTIPKGLLDGQERLEAAKREFFEETGVRASGEFLDLGSVVQKSGKTVHAWAFEGNADPSKMKSNVIEIEWPSGSGKKIEIPEIDRCAWFLPDEAKRKINPAQRGFIDRLVARVSERQGM